VFGLSLAGVAALCGAVPTQRLTPARQRVLEALRNGMPGQPAELARAAGGGPAVLRALVGCGLSEEHPALTQPPPPPPPAARPSRAARLAPIRPPALSRPVDRRAPAGQRRRDRRLQRDRARRGHRLRQDRDLFRGTCRRTRRRPAGAGPAPRDRARGAVARTLP